MATALYGFLCFSMNRTYLSATNTFRSLILILLCLSGFGAVYLGDYWLSDIVASFLFGGFLCLGTCIGYRKQTNSEVKKEFSLCAELFLLTTLAVATLLSVWFNLKHLACAHTLYQKEYTLEHISWWNQKKPILPLYRLNRLGKRTNLFNIQYAGNLNYIEDYLQYSGWKQHDETFFKKIVLRLDGSTSTTKIPLLTQLYQNKRPVLNMIYKDQNANTVVQLTLWQSNYFLHNKYEPLWIGSVYTYSSHKQDLIKTMSRLLSDSQQFTFRRVTIPDSMIKSTIFQSTPCILLIKNHESPE